MLPAVSLTSPQDGRSGKENPPVACEVADSLSPAKGSVGRGALCPPSPPPPVRRSEIRAYSSACSRARRAQASSACAVCWVMVPTDCHCPV